MGLMELLFGEYWNTPKINNEVVIGQIDHIETIAHELEENGWAVFIMSGMGSGDCRYKIGKDKIYFNEFWGHWYNLEPHCRINDNDVSLEELTKFLEEQKNLHPYPKSKYKRTYGNHVD